MFPRNENRNKGTFGCSSGTKTGTRVRSHVRPERRPERGHIRQNHPFTKPPFCLPMTLQPNTPTMSSSPTLHASSDSIWVAHNNLGAQTMEGSFFTKKVGLLKGRRSDRRSPGLQEGVYGAGALFPSLSHLHYFSLVFICYSSPSPLLCLLRRLCLLRLLVLFFFLFLL